MTRWDSHRIARRLGLGVRLDQTLPPTPEAWLAQASRPETLIWAGAPSTESRFAALQAYQEERRKARMEDPAAQVMGLRQAVAEDFLARTRLACRTEAGFAEAWALFWCNWFTVSATKLQTAVLVASYETEAIRPNVFGDFTRLLMAASLHPAMLLYLDQAQSVGPNSRAGQRREAGLNENLAREILELHTLGSDGGYTQADVTEFARALTGHSLNRQTRAYNFVAALHEPGTRTVLTKRYPDTGGDQALEILRDLAAHPATARHVARGLATYFHSDTPPASLITRLENRFRQTGGDLKILAEALLTAPEMADPSARKIRSPYEHLVFAYRAAGREPTAVRQIAPMLNTLGQRPFTPPSPEGWPSDEASWATPSALMTRLIWAQQVAPALAPAPAQKPTEWADTILGADHIPATLRQALSRAQSRTEAFAVLLMSPEGLYR
ncbi:MAG: DUF1800 family protein [Asticcacaulis sp.]